MTFFTSTKDFIIVGLCSLAIVLAIATTYFSRQSGEVKTKTEIQYVNINKPMTFKQIEQRLLNQGVATAWKDKIGGVTTDCFSTNILDDGRSIFSYCKLRKKLLPINE
jgi:hypothetical protein